MSEKVGRNDSCHCGSGKKYKICCLSKDREVKKEFTEKMKSMQVMSMSAGLAGNDDIFDSKDDILESIKAEGFEPVATEETYEDFEDDMVTHMTVDLYCKHGHSEIGREYILRDDGKWECTEEGYSMPCPECEYEE